MAFHNKLLGPLVCIIILIGIINQTKCGQLNGTHAIRRTVPIKEDLTKHYHHHHHHHPDEEQDKIINKKITIIVGEEGEPITSTSSSITTTTNPNTSSSNGTIQEQQLSSCQQQKATPKFYLDEITKLIYIHESNASGYLIGEINNGTSNENSKEASKSLHESTRPSSQKSSIEVFDRLHKHRQPPLTGGMAKGDGSNPTNYSVYLVSRDKNHIAILLDIEEIDFEPIINCEYQELRFSIVGEISKQLLSRRNGSSVGGVPSPSIDAEGRPLYEDVGAGDADTEVISDDTSEETRADEEEEEEEIDQQSSPSANNQASAESTNSPLPVSEAMALLLNSPLNKTILDESDETNDFKIIDSTIDFLHEETCRELMSESTMVSGDKQRVDSSRHRKLKRGNKKHGRKTRHRKMSQQSNGDNVCRHGRQKFKDLMSSKLNDNFEWDDFKIICGKTKQLVVPMRSMKLSVYSDEFSPSSRFVIRYQFISDPSLLPGHDNGKYYCRNRNVIDLDLKCNGIDDCGDASDESIKICGYPSGRSNEPSSSSSVNSIANFKRLNNNGTSASAHKINPKKLTYVNGDVLHCCQSNDWMSILPQGQSNQINLQTLIGDSMNLFQGPLFAPTKSKTPLKRFKRIVGGSVAQRGVWPGQVSLQYELLEPLCHFCAGTLIHPQYVLTAGHCITKDGLNRGIKVVLGAHDLRQLSGNHIQVRYVDDAQIYPGVDVKHLSYDWENDMNNDIALLRLNAPVLITPHVAPACLPPFNTPLAVNTTCRSIGWGQTHGSGSSNLLKHLSLKVVNSSLCSKELFDRDNDDKESPFGKSKKPSKINPRSGPKKQRGGGGERKRGRFVGDFESTSLDQYSDLTMVCVNNDLGHGICQGDSGGPLYCDRVSSNGEICTEIYGVASFIIQYATVGAMCAVENLPGIFGEVSSKTEWISSTMKMFEQTYRLKYA